MEQAEKSEFKIWDVFDYMLSGAMNIITKLGVSYAVGITKGLLESAGRLINIIPPSEDK